MKLNILYLSIFLNFGFYFAACNRNPSCKVKSFYYSDGVHIGDSIFVNNNLHKIQYFDSTYHVDTIVFDYWENKNILKSQKSYKNGIAVFENIEFNENGTIKYYLFLSDNGKFGYERFYNQFGKADSSWGIPFFNYYVDGVNSKNEVKKDSTFFVSVHIPSPPDCKTDNPNLFYKSNYVNSLREVVLTPKEIGMYSIFLVLRIKDPLNDSIKNFECDNSRFDYAVVH